MGGYLVQRYLESRTARMGVLVAAASAAGARRGALRAMRRNPLVLIRCSMTLSYAPAVATTALVRETFFTDDTPDEIVDGHPHPTAERVGACDPRYATALGAPEAHKHAHAHRCRRA